MRLVSSWEKRPSIVVVRKSYVESQHPRGPDGRWIQGWMGDAVAVPTNRGPGPVMSREEAQRWAASSLMPGPWYHGGTRSGGAVIEEQPRGMDILGRGYYVVDSRAGAESYGTKTKELYINVDKVLVAGSKQVIELEQTREYMDLVGSSVPDVALPIDKLTALQIVAQKAGYQAYTTPTGRYAVVWDARRVAVVAEYPNPQATEQAARASLVPLGPSVYDPVDKAAYVESEHPRDEEGQWTDTGASTPGEWAAALSAPQRDALMSYGTNGYHTVNSFLRGGEEAVATDFERNQGYRPDDLKELAQTAKGRVDEIDAAFRSVPPLTRDETVYRGLILPEGFTPEVGASFSDKAYVSTAAAVDAADEFSLYYVDEAAGGGASDGLAANRVAVAEVTVPEGTQAIDMRAVWGSAVGSTEGIADGESETLLDRGMMFTVTDVSTDELGRYQLKLRAS